MVSFRSIGACSLSWYWKHSPTCWVSASPQGDELLFPARHSSAIADASIPEDLAMKRLASLLLVLSCGCSTSPVAGFLDFAFPAKKIPPNTQWHGGVAGPQPAPPPLAVPTVPVPVPQAPLPGIPVP